ncbi:hypothetical protein GCM10011579_008830 [Streptomyces albiflavescens]|uniref:Mutator family transposase n=1 Tax=Streptomyces albiflavescens TaxID=1623582 RepID=A0A918CZR1_9ACTN|nr:hypothetical protein GCM10011579_008830 [Streptomyces albiflavescens]
MSHGLQTDRGVGEGALGVPGLPQAPCHGGDAGDGGVQLPSEAGGLVVRGRRAGGRHGDGLDEQAEPRAAVHDDLSAQQVEAVDAVRPLVDGVDAVVPVERLDVVLAGVAVAAVDLDGKVVGLQAPLGGPALGDRGRRRPCRRSTTPRTAPTPKKAVKAFEKAYGAKWPKAVKKITDEVDELPAFYDFPAEHWIHLRTTNPIESSFSTVKLRTKATRSAGSPAVALAMVFNLVESAPPARCDRTPPCRPRPGRRLLRERSPRRTPRVTRRSVTHLNRPALLTVA